MNVDSLNDIADKIEKLSEAALSTKPFYRLSDLGKDLGSDIQTLKLLTNKPLSNFVRERLSHKFSIVLSGGQFKTVQALVRNTPLETAQMTPVVLSSKPVDVDTKQHSPRYNYRFWAAFSVPYRDGRRFMNPKDFTFDDVAEDDQPPQGYVEIPPELIAPATVKDRDKLISENIQKWLEMNQLDKSDFYAVRAPKDVLATTGSSVLEVMISALDARQLANNTLTLDVVAALLRKRI